MRPLKVCGVARCPQLDGHCVSSEDEAREACRLLAEKLSIRAAATAPAVRALDSGPVQLANADSRAVLYQEQSYRHLIQVRLCLAACRFRCKQLD